MPTSESYEQALEFGRAAMAHMAALRIAASPHNFRVWYEYTSGRNPDLVRAIDVLISNERDFTPDLCEEIYREYFTEESTVQPLHEASTQLREVLTRFLGVLGEASAGHEAYGAALEHFAGNLTRRNAIELKTIVAAMIEETRKIEAKGRAFETEIAQSKQEVQSLQKSLDDLRQESLTDALTGIPNRRFFDDVLRHAATDAMETGAPLTLLMCDIDHFKKFNDRWGHQIGDQVLRIVAQTLRENIKGRDTVARYGGEEFSAILPQTSLRDAVKVASNLKTSVAHKRLTKKATGEDIGRLTLSVGVSLFVPGEPLPDFIQRADQALYSAKLNGRDRVVSEADAAVSGLAVEDRAPLRAEKTNAHKHPNAARS